MRVWYAEGAAAAILWFANFHGITVPWRSSRLGSTWGIELSRLPLTAGLLYEDALKNDWSFNSILVNNKNEYMINYIIIKMLRLFVLVLIEIEFHF